MKAAKTYGAGLILMMSFAAFIVYTSLGLVKSNEVVDTSTTYISDSSVRESILGYTLPNLREIHGIKITKADRVAYYYEYEADYNQVLNLLASMPFQLDNNRTSVQCGWMNSDSNPLDFKNLSQTELDASSFFWNVIPEEYSFYECLKSPLKHTVMISKTTSRILHRVEVM